MSLDKRVRRLENREWGSSLATAVFHVLKSGTQQTTGTPTVLTGWAAPSITNAAIFSFNGGLGELTVLQDGVYLFTFHVIGINTVNDRSQMNLRVQLDTGSGFANVSGMLDHQYNVRFTGGLQDRGSAQLNNFPLDMSANDSVRLMVSDTGEAQDIISDYARIFALKL